MKSTSLATIVFALSLLTACVKMPTENSHMIDNHPTISFSSSRDLSTGDYVLYVDNLKMGDISKYQAKKNSLMVVSGSHIIKVEYMGKVIMSEKIYLGDGTSKTLVIH